MKNWRHDHSKTTKRVLNTVDQAYSAVGCYCKISGAVTRHDIGISIKVAIPAVPCLLLTGCIYRCYLHSAVQSLFSYKYPTFCQTSSSNSKRHNIHKQEIPTTIQSTCVSSSPQPPGYSPSPPQPPTHQATARPLSPLKPAAVRQQVAALSTLQ